MLIRPSAHASKSDGELLELLLPITNEISAGIGSCKWKNPWLEEMHCPKAGSLGGNSGSFNDTK
jgi:hypothetical protein